MESEDTSKLTGAGTVKGQESSKLQRAHLRAVQGRRCFVCNDFLRGNVSALNKAYTKFSNTQFAECLKVIAKDNFRLVINDNDKICQKCAGILQERDKLMHDTQTLNKTLNSLLTRKYTFVTCATRNNENIKVTQGVFLKEDRVANAAQMFPVIPKKNDADKIPATVTKNVVPTPAFPTLSDPVPAAATVPTKYSKNPKEKKVELYECSVCRQIIHDFKKINSHVCPNIEPLPPNNTTDMTTGNPPKETRSIVINKEEAHACHVCDKIFGNKAELAEHSKGHEITVSTVEISSYEKGEYTCSSCKGKYGSYDKIAGHLTPTLKICTNNCGTCDIVFDTKEDFHVHLQEKHNNDNMDNHLAMKVIYICACCKKEFIDLAEYNSHKEGHVVKVGEEKNTGKLQKSVYECGMCTHREDDMKKLIVHFQVHKSSKIVCKYCEITLPTVNDLSKHLLYHSKYNQEYKCPLCENKTLPNKDIFMKHMADLHRMKHQCLFCTEQFRFNRELLKHQSCHPEGKRYGCPKCEKRFGRITQLKRHLSIEHRERKCRFCSKEIQDLSKLYFHELRHKKQSYPCKKCARIFKTPSGLRNHLATHTGLYTYKCDTCGRGFMNRKIFTEHTNNHLETPKVLYKCDICNKNFYYQGSLWIHKKWHTNPYPYECKLCGKKVRHASILQVHMRKHKGDRPFKCPYCPMSFSNAGTFKRHLMLHTGNYTYKCEECNKGFTSKNKYYLHRFQVHGEAIPSKSSNYKVSVPVNKEPQTVTVSTEDSEPTTYIVETIDDADDVNIENERVVEVVINEESEPTEVNMVQ